MSDHPLNAPSRGGDYRPFSGTMANGRDETSTLPTNFPQLPRLSISNRRDRNDHLSSSAMSNGREEIGIATLPTNFPQLRHQSTPSRRDEDDRLASVMTGNGWEEISTLPTNFPQLRRQWTQSRRDENVLLFSGMTGNGQEDISNIPTNLPLLRRQLTPHRDENDLPFSDTMVNGEEEVSSLLTNSPWPQRQPPISGNHIQDTSFSSTVVDYKKRKWIYNRILWCIIAMAIALSLGIPIGFVRRIRDFSVPHQPNSSNSTIKLGALLVDIDPHLNTMTVDWLVAVGLTCDGQPCPIYDIFFDSSVLVSGSRNSLKPSANNSISRTPIFSIDTAVDSILANSPLFTTEISLFPGISVNKTTTRSLQSYPFDRYLAEITIFAQNRNDTSHNPDKDHRVPISIIVSRGIAAGFMTKVDTSDTFRNEEIVNLVIDISRGIEVQIYAVVIIIAIWLVTLVHLSATISAILLGHKLAKEVLLIPIATLFAFTSLRGTMPSAPQGFGAVVDYIGILPCLAILTFCAVLHVGIFLIRNPEQDRSDVEKMKLNE